MAHFRRISTYRGETTFEVSDRAGNYTATLRTSAEPWSAIWNYTPAEYERDVIGAVGLLHASGRQIPEETVAAFNDWRARTHADFCAQILAQPDRYGVTDPRDPLLTENAPTPVRGAIYELGTGWKLTAAAAGPVAV